MALPEFKALFAPKELPVVRSVCRDIRSRRILLEKVFPYSQAGRIQTIRKYGQLLEEEYQEDGIAVKAYVPAELFGKLYSD